jgi:hypothetical protein
MPDFDITGVNQFGGARLPEPVPVEQQMQMIPQQGIVPPQGIVAQPQEQVQTMGIDPAVAAKLFAPVEEIPYGY